MKRDLSGRRTPLRRFAPLVPLAALMLGACTGGGGGGTGEWIEVAPAAEGTGESLELNGTVRHLDVEGGVFVIEDSSGTRYNPTNLPESFQVDGMRVEAEARRRDDMVSIGMVGTMVELLRVRRHGGSIAAAGTGSTDSIPPRDLRGTDWRLEDLGGKGVIDNVEATLEFGEDDSVAGSGSCNRFRGTATISGATISFRPLASTRMACPQAVMNQENAYLDALRGANRFKLEGQYLFIYTSSRAEPLRFIGE